MSRREGKNFCPTDKSQVNVPVAQLSCCYAILNHLPPVTAGSDAAAAPLDSETAPPSGNSRPLHCKRHTNKKIRFVCELHNEYLCSRCVLEHTGAGHKVSAFSADCTIISHVKPVDGGAKTAIAEMQKRFQLLLKTLGKYKEKIDRKISSAEEHFAKQLARLEHEYAKVGRLAAQKQQDLGQLLVQKRKDAEAVIANSQATNSRKISKLGKLLEQLKGCLGLGSLEGFRDLIENAAAQLTLIEGEIGVTEILQLGLRPTIGGLAVLDRSDVVCQSGPKRSSVPQDLTTQTGRAHSTARGKRTASRSKKPHKRPETEAALRVGLQRPIRHETLSPAKDERHAGKKVVMILSPSSQETTAANSVGNTTKAAQARFPEPFPNLCQQKMVVEAESINIK